MSDNLTEKTGSNGICCTKIFFSSTLKNNIKITINIAVLL